MDLLRANADVTIITLSRVLGYHLGFWQNPITINYMLHHSKNYMKSSVKIYYLLVHIH